jgi:hypothetical protein
MKNNRYYLIIAFFFVAAIAAFLLNLYTEKQLKAVVKRNKPVVTEKVEISQKSNTPTKMTGSLLDLMALNQPVRCLYSEFITEGTTLNGTVYSNGESIRSNARLRTPESETQTNTIYSNDLVYIWLSGERQGMKMDMQKYEAQIPKTAQTTESVIPTELIKLDKEFEFDCTKWVPDNNMFTPPTTFSFVDVTDAMFKINENPCLICDTLEISRQAQCKKSYNCK